MQKKCCFVLVLALFLALFSACGGMGGYVEEPVLRVTAGETVLYQGKNVGEWSSGGTSFISCLPALEDLAKNMIYAETGEEQATLEFSLPPNHLGVECWQYVDGELVAGKTALTEDGKTLELLPGKWIYQIITGWSGQNYSGGGRFTFGVEKE